MKLNIGFIFLIGFSLLCVMGCNTKFQIASSKSQVTNLKDDGCLFVRLHHYPMKIKKLNELGYKKAAIAETNKISAANKSLISAFKKNWNFSSVYFFYPEESMKIRESNFKDVNFLNDKLEVDPTIKCSCDYALTVEESHIQRTAKVEGETAKPGEYGYFHHSGTYYYDSSQPIKGFIVKSNEFIQLHSPFPFYTRRYKFLFERSDEAMVKELNHNFHHYFKVANK